MSTKIVSIIIVTCGVGEVLRPCLDSVGGQTHQAKEVFLIDNSLNPAFASQIKADFPQVVVHSGSKSLFYCAALNLGIEKSQGEFVLCLNDDVVLDRRCIEQSLPAFGRDGRIGMVSPKILRDDAGIIDSTGLFLSIWRTAKERGYGRPDKGQYQRPGYIFGVNGAVAFYRRRMLEDIKAKGEYFDSSYRIFYEDLDIAWRAQRKGWRGYYWPQALAYHRRGHTVRGKSGMGKKYARRYISDELQVDLIKNRYLTLIKNESLLGFLLHLPFLLCYEIFIWSYVLILRPQAAKKLFSLRIIFKAAWKKRFFTDGGKR